MGGALCLAAHGEKGVQFEKGLLQPSVGVAQVGGDRVAARLLQSLLGLSSRYGGLLEEGSRRLDRHDALRDGSLNQALRAWTCGVEALRSWQKV